MKSFTSLAIRKNVLPLILVLIGVLLIVWLQPKTPFRQRAGSGLEILEAKEKARLFFVGDMSFDRYIRKVAQTKGEDFIFSCMSDVLKEADLVVGNLETTITNYPSVSVDTEIGSPNNFIFTSPSSTAALLARHNITVVNLGNNHTDDFGKDGMKLTRHYLEQSGISYFGGTHGDEPIYRTRLGDTDLSFISYNQFNGDYPEIVADKIEAEKKNGRTVLVYTHWSEEYASTTLAVKKTAELFAKAGASLIIGSHPHIILPSAKIGNTLVYYSLGNFIFDQYWNREVSTGLLLEVIVQNSSLDIREHRVSIQRDGRTCPG